MAPPPKTRYAQSGDLSIAYQVIGDGPIDLVFVPGFVSHLDLIWENRQAVEFFERLASFARVVLHDKRGQGLSDRPPEPPTLEQGMDDLRAVMDAAAVERAALLGVSEGGPMSILCAATHPDRVSHLILYGTYARLVVADDYEPGHPREVIEAFFRVLSEEWGGPAALGVFAPSVQDDSSFQEWWARFLRQGTSPRGAQALLRLYLEMDVRHALEAIAIPSLVLHRTDDVLVPIDHARYLAAHIPSARFVELPGNDHIFTVGDAQAMLDEVEEFLTGERHVHPIDRVLSTVMFTDIVGSTERAASLGDGEWRRMIERHDELVRRQVARYRGKAVKALGDGFLATFDGPARGIECARAIAAGVRGLGLEIRAGLHTGECELRGDDVSGMAINIGARVSSLAGAGEVLVSSTVKDLVVGSGIEFKDRGEHPLKGVPGEWRLYSVSDGGPGESSHSSSGNSAAASASAAGVVTGSP